MKNNNLPFAAHKVMLSVLVATGAAMSSIQLQAANEIPVQVFFSGNCPTGVDPENIEMSKAGQDKVRWTAYDATSRQPLTTVSYQIFFDPFKGKSMDSGNNGEILSQPVAGDVPVNVNFKYTVFTEGCTPVDPNIRIR